SGKSARCAMGCDSYRVGRVKGKARLNGNRLKIGNGEGVCVSDLFGDEDEQVFEMRWRWLFVGSW
mgnify:CR=1